MAKMIVKRLGVLSFAKIQAVIMAFFGVIIGVIYGLVFMIFGAAMMAQGGGAGAGAGAGVGGVVLGLVFMVAMPIFYGAIGFIFGALGALIYNVASGFIGGLEMELESAATDYGTPPPPQQPWPSDPYQAGQQQPY